MRLVTSLAWASGIVAASVLVQAFAGAGSPATQPASDEPGVAGGSAAGWLDVRTSTSDPRDPERARKLLAEMERAYAEAKRQLDLLEAEGAALASRPLPPRDFAGRPLRGVVLARQAEGGREYATVSLGEDQGLANRVRLKVVRGSQFLGVLDIEKITPGRSTGRLTGPKVQEIVPGEIVVTSWDALRGGDFGRRQPLARVDAEGGRVAEKGALVAKAWAISPDDLLAALDAEPEFIRDADADGETLLHTAARKQDEALVAALLRRGADPNATNREGWAPLDLALMLHLDDVADRLLAGGARPGPHALAGLGRSDALKDALAQHPDRAKARIGGWTPLHFAATHGRDDAIRVLGAAGADANAAGPGGVNAMSQAAYGGHAGAVSELAALKADPAARDEDGRTPLHDAALAGHVEVVRLLLRLGAPHDAATTAGGTPLSSAAGAGHMAVVKALLERPAKPEHVARAFERAVGEGDGDSVRLLLRHGARPDDRVYGQIPLHVAARRPRRDVVEALLEAGATVDAADPEGGTALHHACVAGDVGTVKALVAAGARPSARDGKGRTPLDLAELFHRAAVVRYLRGGIG